MYAVVATVVGCTLAWSGPMLARFGVVVPLLQMLYDYGWFVGSGASGITYLILMKLAPPLGAGVARAEAG